MYTPANPIFFIYIKVGFEGVKITKTCFRDVVVLFLNEYICCGYSLGEALLMSINNICSL